MKKRIILFLTIACLIFGIAACAEETTQQSPYTLAQVSILSRHNLRAPLSSNGSVPDDLSIHEWIKWSAPSSSLTLKGALLETRMGQYFQQYLEAEGLTPVNYIPEEGETRFYANAKQRTIATARYFASGMMPVADISIERHADVGKHDDTFNPVLHFYSDSYADAVNAQLLEIVGEDGIAGVCASLEDGIQLVMEITGMTETEAYQSGKYGDLLAKEGSISLEVGKEPDVGGPLKTAAQVADALLLQYYEEPDDVKAAFGHDLSQEDWEKIVSIKDTYYYLRHGLPLVSLNVAHPVLEELQKDLTAEGRKFSFLCAHDVTIIAVLSSLGVEHYELSGSLEKRVPIGSKLVFERYVDAEGASWYQVSLMYQSAEQIRQISQLSMDEPPMKCVLSFQGIATNADGLIAEADLLNLLQKKIDAFTAIEETYPNDTDAEELQPAA